MSEMIDLNSETLGFGDWNLGFHPTLEVDK